MTVSNQPDDQGTGQVHIRRQIVRNEDPPVLRIKLRSEADHPVRVRITPSSNDSLVPSESGRDNSDAPTAGPKEVVHLLAPGETEFFEFECSNRSSDEFDITVGLEAGHVSGNPGENRIREHLDNDRKVGLASETTVGSGNNGSHAAEATEEAEVDGVQKTDVNQLLIGIPAYNEASTVGSVIRAARGYAGQVLVVDDGSVDETAAAARRAGASVISHGENKGYGAALSTVFQTARDRGFEHLIILDADGQHDPADIPRLIEAQQTTGAELVIGSRFVKGAVTDMPRYRRVGVEVVNLFTNAGLVFGYGQKRLADTQCGFRLYKRDAIETLAQDQALGSGMDASTDILFELARAGCTFTEVPTTVDYDVDDASTHNPVTHGITLIKSVVGRLVRDRPGRFLGLPAMACLAVGMAIIVSAATVATGLTLLIVGLAFAVAGLLSGGALAFRRRTLGR